MISSSLGACKVSLNTLCSFLLAYFLLDIKKKLIKGEWSKLRTGKSLYCGGKIFQAVYSRLWFSSEVLFTAKLTQRSVLLSHFQRERENIHLSIHPSSHPFCSCFIRSGLRRQQGKQSSPDTLFPRNPLQLYLRGPQALWDPCLGSNLGSSPTLQTTSTDFSLITSTVWYNAWINWRWCTSPVLSLAIPHSSVISLHLGQLFIPQLDGISLFYKRKQWPQTWPLSSCHPHHP